MLRTYELYFLSIPQTLCTSGNARTLGHVGGGEKQAEGRVPGGQCDASKAGESWSCHPRERQ